MPKILADREIKELLGKVILDAEEQCVNPNGIELRLGKSVRFFSTGETKKLEPGLFLRVSPGETVIISSLEKLDFSKGTVQSIYPNKMLMALVTPTTTMMREGILQIATKIDAGFRGNLNWSFRNSSTEDFTIGYAEPLFKITLLLLEKDESPDLPYGEREGDTYQDTNGINLSKRKISSQISKKTIVSSGFEKLDHKQRLQEAGYPFSHIGSELASLQGNFELVSKEVGILKDHFKQQTTTLSSKIENETQAVSDRLNDFKDTFFQKVEALFTQKFFRIVGILIGALTIIISLFIWLIAKNIETNLLVIIGIVAGVVIVAVTWLVTQRRRH